MVKVVRVRYKCGRWKMTARNIASAFEDAELIKLLPIEVVSNVIGRQLKLVVHRDRESIQSWNLTYYNTCLFVDAHLKYAHLPRNHRHPLHGKFDSIHTDDRYLEKLNGEHNQVLLIDDSDIPTITLHLAGIRENALFLNYIELVNPNRKAQRPFDCEQVYEGIGHGVFGTVLERLAHCAGEHGFHYLKCHAIDRPRADLFIRKAGFTIDDSDEFLYNAAMANECQIPLVIRIESE
jgi:hypothetical protein